MVIIFAPFVQMQNSSARRVLENAALKAGHSVCSQCHELHTSVFCPNIGDHAEILVHEMDLQECPLCMEHRRVCRCLDEGK